VFSWKEKRRCRGRKPLLRAVFMVLQHHVIDVIWKRVYS
jgi:hypothetical protein